MDSHIHDARQQLTDLAALASKTESAERSILASAEKRMKVIESELSDTRRWSMVVTPAEQVSRSQGYQNLITERGILHQVISQSRTALGGA